MAGGGRRDFRRVGRHLHPHRRVLQISEGGEQFGEALRHLLVGAEQHRAQDDGITGETRDEGTETGCGRTTTRLRSSGLIVAMRSAMAVDGATIMSERRAARCTTAASRRT